MVKGMFRGLGALALALLCACGGDDGAAPAQRSMVPAKQRNAAREGNRAPAVARVRFVPANPEPGDAIEARPEASDPDGDSLRFSYRWTVNGRPLAVTGATLPAGSTQREDRVEVAVVANDGLLESADVRSRVSVSPSAPHVQAIYFDPHEGVKPGDELTALVDASAADDAQVRLEYVWLVNGDETREHKRSFPTAGLHRGDRVQVKVTAFDGDAAGDPVVSGELVLANSPPAIAGIPAPQREGDAFRYQFEAKDPDGDRSLRYALTKAPTGMTIDPIYGVATWRPTKEQAGTHAIEVKVSDNHGDASTLAFEVTVTATETPAPPADGREPAQAAKPAPAKAAPAEAAPERNY
jgi:hypothetical protein